MITNYRDVINAPVRPVNLVHLALHTLCSVKASSIVYDATG